MNEPIDPRNDYGIRGYNKLYLKECSLLYPDTMGCGAEKPRHLITKPIDVRKIFTGKRLPRRPEGYSEKHRPKWHVFTYGCKRKKY